LGILWEKFGDQAFKRLCEANDFLVGHPAPSVLDFRHNIPRDIPTLALAFRSQIRLTDFDLVPNLPNLGTNNIFGWTRFLHLAGFRS
jgi:hypothetical protein